MKIFFLPPLVLHFVAQFGSVLGRDCNIGLGHAWFDSYLGTNL